MKGLIIQPARIQHSWISFGRYLPLFDLIQKELGWDVIITNDADPRRITADIVMTFKSPIHGANLLERRIPDLPKDIKLICYNMDLHTAEDFTGGGTPSGNWKNAFIRMFKRANKVICPYRYFFKKKWPQFVNKLEWFPHFVDLQTYSNIKFNHNPVMKCLLTGSLSKDAYPFREYIFNNKNSNIIRLDHPGYSKAAGPENKIDKEYANELNKYFCSVATCSKVNYVVSKYFEIPAAGSLLLANHTPDLDDLGFIDRENYVKVDESNFFTVLKDVFNNPKQYEKIRYAGRDFVLGNFTNRDRFNQFKRMVKKVMEE